MRTQRLLACLPACQSPRRFLDLRGYKRNALVSHHGRGQGLLGPGCVKEVSRSWFFVFR